MLDPDKPVTKPTYEDLTVWDEPLRRAQDEHARCLKRWDRLTPQQRATTTFHGLDAHIRDTQGKDGIDHVG